LEFTPQVETSSENRLKNVLETCYKLPSSCTKAIDENDIQTWTDFATGSCVSGSSAEIQALQLGPSYQLQAIYPVQTRS
jgi:hypothetical protein